MKVTNSDKTFKILYNAHIKRQTITYNDLTPYMSYDVARQEMRKKNKEKIIQNKGKPNNALYTLTQKGLLQYKKISEDHWVKVENLLNKPKNIGRELKVNIRYVKKIVKGVDFTNPHISRIIGITHVYGVFDHLRKRYEGIAEMNAKNRAISEDFKNVKDPAVIQDNSLRIEKNLDNDKGLITLTFYKMNSDYDPNEIDVYNKSPVIFDVTINQPIQYDIIQTEIFDFLIEELTPLNIDNAIKVDEFSNYEVISLVMTQDSVNKYNINSRLLIQFAIENDLNGLFELKRTGNNQTNEFVRLTTVYSKCRIKADKIPQFINLNSPTGILSKV